MQKYENYQGAAGNDYTQAFVKKEKIRPIQLIQKNQAFLDAFTNLGDFPLNTDTLDVLEGCTCHLYGHAKQNEGHEVNKFTLSKNLNCNELN